MKIEDKLLVRLGRDGRLNTFELSGLLTLRISDEKFGRIKVKLENNDTRGIQLQTHPNVDKDLFRGKGLIGLKNPAKPFPLNTDVGVLKWRYQTQEERALPLMSELDSIVVSVCHILFIYFLSQLLADRKHRRWFRYKHRIRIGALEVRTRGCLYSHSFAVSLFLSSVYELNRLTYFTLLELESHQL